MGSFEEGYAFDAVVMDDSSVRQPRRLKVRERLERLVYLSGECRMAAKFIDGRVIFREN